MKSVPSTLQFIRLLILYILRLPIRAHKSEIFAHVIAMNRERTTKNHTFGYVGFQHQQDKIRVLEFLAMLQRIDGKYTRIRFTQISLIQH